MAIYINLNLQQPFIVTCNNVTALFLVEPEGTVGHCSEAFVFICKTELVLRRYSGAYFFSLLEVDMLINL